MQCSQVKQACQIAAGRMQCLQHQTWKVILLLSFVVIAFVLTVEKMNMKFEILGISHPSRCELHNQDRFLMVHLIGGLGNQLWIYSSLYGLAKKTDRKPLVCVGYDMRILFKNLSAPFYTYKECGKGTPLHPNNSLHVGQRNNHLYYDPDMIDVLKTSQTSHAFICCYLQNLGFFVEYFNDLKAQFVIRDKYQLLAQKYLKDLLQDRAGTAKLHINKNGVSLIDGMPPVFVTVHIRRGNMLAEKNVKVPGPSYFKQAMDYFRKKYGKSVIFVVATEDRSWSKANLTGDDVYFTGDNYAKSREEEFAIAVACNHTIMSVGTFGWWMGFLTGGDVVFFKDWVLGDWNRWYNQGQFFPQKWIPM